jgi:hypothetical protein
MITLRARSDAFRSRSPAANQPTDISVKDPVQGLPVALKDSNARQFVVVVVRPAYSLAAKMSEGSVSALFIDRPPLAYVASAQQVNGVLCSGRHNCTAMQVSFVRDRKFVDLVAHEHLANRRCSSEFQAKSRSAVADFVQARLAPIGNDRAVSKADRRTHSR